MARRKTLAPSATIIKFPSPVQLDVRDVLLNNQTSPTVDRPHELDAAIDARARELAEEAYELCREHLQRRVAYHCEHDWPRRLNLEKAKKVIGEGSLAEALTRVYRRELEAVAWVARAAADTGPQFAAIVDRLFTILGTPNPK